MGVVTDVTVKGLTTAVTNISATGMSDTTGQAIVTSINNLRSATSPIITDDTGQDIKDELTAIKSAVQGLGTALGSDRALIDGSNIANPSAFKTNIGLNTQSYKLEYEYNPHR